MESLMLQLISSATILLPVYVSLAQAKLRRLQSGRYGDGSADLHAIEVTK